MSTSPSERILRPGVLDDAPRVPGWARGLGVIVMGPRDRTLFMNRHAEELLGRTWGECRDLHCRDFVCGVRASGASICKGNCALRELARNAQEIPPTQVRGLCEDEAHVLMTSVPFEIDESSLHILHLFHRIEREFQLREHARLVAYRSSDVRVSADIPPRSVLTGREQDVLEHLAHDEDPQRVAVRLFRSPATVRNHVRHILKKLGAHSIEEAVALHLLYDPLS